LSRSVAIEVAFGKTAVQSRRARFVVSTIDLFSYRRSTTL